MRSRHILTLAGVTPALRTPGLRCLWILKRILTVGQMCIAHVVTARIQRARFQEQSSRLRANDLRCRRLRSAVRALKMSDNLGSHFCSCDVWWWKDGIGTARAFQVSEEMGAFSGLGMGLNGVLAAFVVPILLPVLLRWL